MDRYAFYAVCIMAGITFLLRALPFVLFSGKKTPAFVLYLGDILPYAIMGMLVVYCLKDMSFQTPSGFVPHLAALAVTAGTYLWKKNTLFGIVGGTAVYMLLVQLVF